MVFVSRGAIVQAKTPLSLTGGSSYFPYVPGMSSAGIPSAYAGLYGSQLWVYVVVAKRARATARLPLPVYERNDLDRPRADAHPMAQLLSHPNPGMSGFGLWLWTSSIFDIYGEAFWYKRRDTNSGAVTGLFPLHPASMVDHQDGTWSFNNGRLRLDEIPVKDLVIFRSFNPASLTRGLSPLEPLRATLENEFHARRATSSFWQRGARPGFVLLHPENISQAAQDRLRAQFASAHEGSDRTGSTLLLEEGMTPKVMELNAEDAQYIETRRLNREEVCAAYDIPPPVVHILDRATFSNITEQMRSMYRDSMAPHLAGFESAVELYLRAVEWPDDPVYAEFLMDEVLRGDFETRVDAYAKATYMTIAEKRRSENLPFIEGTDRILLNTATMPLDAIDQLAAAQAAGASGQLRAIALVGGTSEQGTTELLPAPVLRTVMGRLSWQKLVSQVDVDALVDGLEPDHADVVRGAAARCAGSSVSELRAALKGSRSRRAGRVPDLSSHRSAGADAVAEFIRDQGRAVVATGEWDAQVWDEELGGILAAIGVSAATAAGRSVIRGLGHDPAVWDIERVTPFLESVGARVAANVNATTKAAYDQPDDEDDREAVFEAEADARSSGIAGAVVTMAAGFGAVEAGRRLTEAGTGKPVKTWSTGSNPRPTHAALNGESVGIDEAFSNGMSWPGEGGDVDEVAGCNCTVEVSFP